MPSDNTRNRLLARSTAVKGPLQLRQPLRIAVLGPGIGRPLSKGGRKRQQIRDALQSDGHAPFYPEDLGVTLNPLDPAALEQEADLLRDPSVHLVVLLHTHSSAGAMGEIYSFWKVPEIEEKMAVMVPAEFYKPTEDIFGNTVQRFRTRFPYSPHLFETCQLVAECRMWAQTMATGGWPTRQPFQV